MWILASRREPHTPMAEGLYDTLPSHCRFRARGEKRACPRPREHSYSEYDPQECVTSCADRNGSGNGPSGLGLNCGCVKRRARTCSRCGSVLITHLCVWCLQCGRVLFCVSQSSVVIEGVDAPIFPAHPGVRANLGPYGFDRKSFHNPRNDASRWNSGRTWRWHRLAAFGSAQRRSAKGSGMGAPGGGPLDYDPDCNGRACEATRCRHIKTMCE